MNSSCCYLKTKLITNITAKCTGYKNYYYGGTHFCTHFKYLGSFSQEACDTTSDFYNIHEFQETQHI